MGDFWFKFKIWAKTTLFAVLAVYALIFILKNSSDDVRFWWWFGHNETHNKLAFGFACFVAGVIVTIMIRTTISTMRQVQDMQSRTRSQRIEKDLQDMKEKAAKLQARPTPPGSAIPGAFEAPDPKE